MARRKTTAQVEQTEATTTEAPKYNGEELLAQMGTKSAVIRHLDQEGLTRSQIAKVLGIRYQHVRNVLITPLKRTAE